VGGAAQAGRGAKKEEKPAEGEPKKESRSDAVSGKWEATVTGGQGPEPQKMTLYLRLDGTHNHGRSTSASGGVVKAAGRRRRQPERNARG
jgi:hypothetical protein